MQRWLVLCVFLLCALEPVTLHEDDVSEMLRNINVLLGNLVTRSNTQLRELQSLKVDLTSLNNKVSGLSDSLGGLNDSVSSLQRQLNEHREQTATALTSLNLLMTEELRSGFHQMKEDILQFMRDNMTEISRQQQQTASEVAQLQTTLSTTRVTLQERIESVGSAVCSKLENQTDLLQVQQVTNENVYWWLGHILNLVQQSAHSQDTKFQSMGENISSISASLQEHQQHSAAEVAQLQVSLSTTQVTLQEEIESTSAALCSKLENQTNLLQVQQVTNENVYWWLGHILNLVQQSTHFQDTKFRSMGENITNIHVSLQQHQQENAATLAEIWNSITNS